MYELKENVKSMFGTLTGARFRFKEANVKSTSGVTCWKTWVWGNTKTGTETGQQWEGDGVEVEHASRVVAR